MTNFSKYKKPHNNIKGIFWDFDGTLVDSHEKNYNVTKKIVEMVTRQSPQSFPILESINEYQSGLRNSTNWRDFYQNYFSFTNEKTDYAGSLWSECQLSDSTPVPVFEGIPQLLMELDNTVHAIISQNARDLINKILEENKLQKYFDFIVGYEEVGIRNQKPDPTGLITSMEKIEKPVSGKYVYIGDHETDVKFASNANSYLNANSIDAKVISVAAHLQSQCDEYPWSITPDFQAHSVLELKDILRKALLG
ncbi:MAG: HAD family hydrolase [Calditrichia bacterium]|nr:HAD family hydrolase [Calditrichia bacterium]